MARWFVVAGVVVVLVAGTFAVMQSEPTDGVVAAPPSSTTSTATTTVPPTTQPPVPSTTVPEVDDSPILLADPVVPADASPALPVPESIPSNPRAATPEVVLGTIRIPAIDLTWKLGQGMTLTAIDRGPSHWPGTAMPGELGNMVIAGHRTTKGAPFRHLDSLVPGDEIAVDIGAETHVYAVTETIIVYPEDVWIADQTEDHLVTLFACHPVGSARQRIVVRGEWVSTDVATLPTTSR